MSANSQGFQALPGATPDNSAFIDLYFDPSVKGYPRRSRVQGVGKVGFRGLVGSVG